MRMRNTRGRGERARQECAVYDSASSSSASSSMWGGRIDVERKRRERFEKAGGAAYLLNVLREEDAETVRMGCQRLRGRVSGELGSTASGRLGCVVTSDSAMRRIFEQHYVVERLREAIGATTPIALAKDVPMEYRVYRPGSEMDWHSDDLLFAVPQLEIVYTVVNDSDAATEWKDASGKRIHREETLPNSCLIVRAGQSVHRVRKLRRGERTILKMAYVHPDAAKLDSFSENFSEMYM